MKTQTVQLVSYYIAGFDLMALRVCSDSLWALHVAFLLVFRHVFFGLSSNLSRALAIDDNFVQDGKDGSLLKCKFPASPCTFISIFVSSVA